MVKLEDANDKSLPHVQGNESEGQLGLQPLRDLIHQATILWQYVSMLKETKNILHIHIAF